MIAERNAEHAELVLVPAANDIQSEAAIADMIAGGDLLGGEDRIDQSHMQGGKGDDVFGRRQQPAGPNQGFERRAVMIGLAAIAGPAAKGQHELKPRRVGHLRDLDIVFPSRLPTLRHRRAGNAAGTVGGKYADLELVAVRHVTPPFKSPMASLARHASRQQYG